MFITFEGIDGSGKSTQITRTAEWLSELGYDVLTSREPGGTPLGEAIREILLDPRWQGMVARAEYFLLCASRAQLVDEIIRPHLARSNGVVILDRYDDSSTAYQGGGREIGIEKIREVNRFATAGLVPDITFYLDLDWGTSLQRRRRAGGGDDRMEQGSKEFFERVRDAYRTLCAAYPERMIHLDGSRSEPEVFAQIKAVLAQKFGMRG